MALVQWHPRLRRIMRNNRKFFFGVFLIFLFVFFASEHERGHIEGDARRESDQIVALKAQLGYLKSKLARECPNVDINANDDSQPTIYAITPTYARPVQKAELVRLCTQFLPVPNLHWIIIEDAEAKTNMVSNFLQGCGVPYTLLNIPTPADWKISEDDPSWLKPKGVLQRNEGLFWIRENIPRSKNGVIYFADDDNTYDRDLFEVMRDTKTVSVWPVGLVGGLMVEKPKVSSDGNKVIGWDAVWNPKRPFALDMAGFAVNLGLFLSKPKAKFAYKVKRGFQESEFLRHLVTMEELEPKASDKVLVWHTRTEKAKLGGEKMLLENGKPPSDAMFEV